MYNLLLLKKKGCIVVCWTLRRKECTRGFFGFLRVRLYAEEEKNMTPQNNQQEAQQAWRLWYQLQVLSDSLWERYYKEFLEIEISETDRQQNIKSDDPQFPF
jgi:hypothetical protein